MKSAIVILPLLLAGCTGARYPQYGEPGRICGLRSQSILKDPTLEQIECLERNGINDERLKEKKAELIQSAKLKP